MNRTATVSLASLLFGVLAAGCGDDGATPPPDGPLAFDRRALLAHAADNFIIPTNARFVTDAAALSTAVTAHCTALNAGNGAATLVTAKAAWVKAMTTWEDAEGLLVGPAARTDNTIRNRIYAWPFVAPCSLDQDTVTKYNTPAAYDVNAVFDNARSLASVEYLLYNTSDTTSCPGVPNGWNELGANRTKARCALAVDIARDVAMQAQVLADAWDPAKGNYRDQLVLAGTAASSIESEREAVNMLSDGLFYFDRMVWDMKVREPAGFKANACGPMTVCLREVEHRYADLSTPSIQANLRTMRIGFSGDTGTVDGPGFEDYMIAVGAPDVAARILAEIDAAIDIADDLPPGYIAALSDNRETLSDLSASLQLLVREFKTQFLTVLSLDIPEEIAGDND